MTSSNPKSGRVDRRQFLAGATVALAAAQVVITPGRARAQSWPERPITLVVMYAAGGGTDTIMRVLGDGMAKAKGWEINVINKPGAVGGIATQFVHAQPADGYTMLGAANYNKFVRVMGHVDLVPWEEWANFQAASALASWSVRTDSPFETFEDVVEAAKAEPGKLTISTSGTGGVWHEAALIVGSAAGIELKYVPYQGGKPATLAGLQGEVDIAGGGVHEHIDLLRAGQLRNLMQAGPQDLEVEGVGTLRSIGSIIPELQPQLPIGSDYNLMMRRDTPVEILKEVEDAFVAAVNSDAFQEIAERQFFQIDIRSGEAADRRTAQREAVTVAIFNEHADQIGAPVKSAEELGLPAPEEFDAWWPPEGYEPRV
ncbi:MAG: Bug family tripartite tricarboxylate transporter substrate binding protein [Geminicoccaceae bacterium]